jgi:hypothetical protein
MANICRVTAVSLALAGHVGLGAQDQRSLQPTRSVAGPVLTSREHPRVRIEVKPPLAHIGAQRFVLRGVADAEQHFFVDADSGNAIRRMYWIQFEQYLPGRGGEYAYDDDQPAILGGLEFRTNVRTFTSAPAPDSDRNRAYAFVEQKGYRMPSPATRIRLVYVPFENRREELMIIYLEPAKAAADPAPDESAALMRRAREGLTITR